MEFTRHPNPQSRTAALSLSQLLLSLATDLGDSSLCAGAFLGTQGEVWDILGNWSCCMARLSSLMPFAEFHSLLGLSQNIIKLGAVTLPPTQDGTLEAMLGSVENLSAKHGGEDTGQNTEHGIS